MKRVKRTIEACKMLRDHYQRKTTLRLCPLCLVHDFCNDCPWFIFEDTHCIDYPRNNGFSKQIAYLKANRQIAYLRANRDNEEWNKLRIRQLTKWIKKLKEGS